MIIQKTKDRNFVISNHENHYREKCTKNIRKIRRKHVPIPKILDNVEGNMYQKY